MEPESEYGSNTISLASFRRLLRVNANFRRLWMAQIVSETGDWFYSLAIYSLLLEFTGRASSIALALILQVLPNTLIGPIAGVVNDRLPRKQVMIASDLARFAIVAAMLLVRSPSMVWLLYLLLILESLMWAFFEPARTAVIPNITSQQDLLLANTVSATTWSVNLVAGAMFGGIVMALLGYQAAFLLNALSFLASAALIGRMHFREPHAKVHNALRVRDLVHYSPMLDGLRYVKGDVRLLATMLAKAGLANMGVSWVLFTVMGERNFPLRWPGLAPQRAAVLGMSLMIGARGLGALMGPLVSARWASDRQDRLRLGILCGFLAVGVGYGCLSGAGSLETACLWVMLAHCGGSTVWVFGTTLLQINVEDRYRGRVFSAELGLSMLTLAAGAYLTGILLDHGIAPRAVALGTGFCMLIPATAWAIALRLWNTSSRRSVLAPEQQEPELSTEADE
ncbi:MAG: MFS transporter [Acidobacteria bacterium]|nr:MFS transporter [Acidobacteriota bacterium]